MHRDPAFGRAPQMLRALGRGSPCDGAAP